MKTKCTIRKNVKVWSRNSIKIFHLLILVILYTSRKLTNNVRFGWIQVRFDFYGNYVGHIRIRHL
jgi:hypothetical protein